jgi:hypothetical protein
VLALLQGKLELSLRLFLTPSAAALPPLPR